jgi:uncharacterized protein (TIGR02271 family)
MNTDLRGFQGRELVDPQGDKIGTIEDIYLDDQTGEPEWLAVRTGMFGMRQSFVPIAGASLQGEQVVCRFDKATVKDAPNADADGALSQDEEARLYSHYGMSYSESQSDSGLPEGGTGTGAGYDAGSGYDTSGPSTDDAMTRSEEELRVGTSSRPAGRARLRKWVETERVSETVPVSHEEVRIEREPITDANAGAALDGPEISEEEHEVPLYEEEVVANTEVVPKERVRMEKETVVDQQQVDADLRKERIEAEGGRAPGA